MIFLFCKYYFCAHSHIFHCNNLMDHEMDCICDPNDTFDDILTDTGEVCLDDIEPSITQDYRIPWFSSMGVDQNMVCSVMNPGSNPQVNNALYIDDSQSSYPTCNIPEFHQRSFENTSKFEDLAEEIAIEHIHVPRSFFEGLKSENDREFNFRRFCIDRAHKKLGDYYYCLLCTLEPSYRYISDTVSPQLSDLTIGRENKLEVLDFCNQLIHAFPNVNDSISKKVRTCMMTRLNRNLEELSDIDSEIFKVENFNPEILFNYPRQCYINTALFLNTFLSSYYFSMFLQSNVSIPIFYNLCCELLPLKNERKKFETYRQITEESYRSLILLILICHRDREQCKFLFDNLLVLMESFYCLKKAIVWRKPEIINKYRSIFKIGYFESNEFIKITEDLWELKKPKVLKMT